MTSQLVKLLCSEIYLYDSARPRRHSRTVKANCFDWFSVRHHGEVIINSQSHTELIIEVEKEVSVWANCGGKKRKKDVWVEMYMTQNSDSENYVLTRWYPYLSQYLYVHLSIV